ncbi:methionyl-tRNA formyltransferase [uncultured Treponema sp.]|uniref:methionyl-tRNA formyltransferase n=1 Tax=Treponema sp. TaxID=166 RepID=UPI0025D8E45A|nr:methionyl-tRNA formyltransferase [uncultured Treponema sp.]MEE0353939.1 methionyl-tRNA formyltransferase [Treponema sp.]
MLKVLFGGSPACAAKALELILKDSAMSNSVPEEEYKIVGVLTNPPSAQGRHKELIPTEVEQYTLIWNRARNDNVAIFSPEHIKQAEREQIASLEPDIFVCFAYGHILGPKFFSLFKFGGINLHPSLLPKYRGATPVNAAILNCDDETGFSIQKMALGMDEGDILYQQKERLTGTETAEQVLKNSALYGGMNITQILRKIAKTGKLPDSFPQEGKASYCSIIKKEDGKINWNNSAEKIDAQIRAYTPWPGCFTTSGNLQLRILKARAASKVAAQDPSIVKNTSAVPGTVLEYNKQRGILIQTGSGVLIATELQWQAKKAMDYKSFMNGARNFIGTVLE